MRKAQLDTSFTWIFALIVGAIILGFALYMSSKIFNIGEETVDAKTAKQISVLLNPLQLGIEDFKSSSMAFSSQTRIFNTCTTARSFGEQKILVSQKSFGEWTNTNMDVSFNNIYIYSNAMIEGQKFTIFAKKFEFPYKVADLIYMIPQEKEYCFVEAPENIKDEVERFNLKNLITNCSSNSIKVCFKGDSNCNILVNYEKQTIERDKTTIYFSDDALMYAGIFSEPQIYECQLKRLMKKTAILADLYKEKASFISRAGCSSNVDSDLIAFSSLVSNLKDSSGIFSLSDYAKDLGEKNDANSNCRLW